jgi:hypothetical protein
MDKKERNMLIITAAGFVIGTAEALIYYNLGESKAGKNKKFTYKIPPTKEFLQTAAIVMVTSVLTAGLTNGIEKLLNNDTENQTAINGIRQPLLLSERKISF